MYAKQILSNVNSRVDVDFKLKNKPRLMLYFNRIYIIYIHKNKDLLYKATT